MTVYPTLAYPKAIYDLGFSFSLKRASRDTPETFTTLNLTPGISPTACPLRPNPAISTSSYSRSTWLASLHRVNNRHKEQWLRNPYILLNVVKATIIRHKGSNLLPVLHQLNTSTLTDGRVRLLGLNTATQWKYLTLAQATQSWDIKSTHDKHTSSPERCPWHEMIQQRVSSIHYPSGSSCMPCQPTSGSCGGS